MHYAKMPIAMKQY